MKIPVFESGKNYKKLISTDRAAILGGSGSGKSHTLYVMIKEMRKKKYPVWILDTSNDFGDLLETGLFKKYKAHKLNPELLPGKLRRNRQSAIIDFKRMKDLSEQRRFISRFIKSCFEKINKYPAIIVLDESHNFVPQRDYKDKVLRECKSKVNKLLSEGRKYGYGVLMVSQRPSKIDKDSLAECKNVFIHRHTMDLDLKKLKGFIGEFLFNNEPINVNKEIPKLKTGELFDVDFENYTLQKYKVPLDKTKKLGRTPRARQVDPLKETWRDKINDIDLGLDESEKITLTIAGVIIIIVFIIIAIVWRSEGEQLIKS